jgi:hypothetical protein
MPSHPTALLPLFCSLQRVLPLALVSLLCVTLPCRRNKTDNTAYQSYVVVGPVEEEAVVKEEQVDRGRGSSLLSLSRARALSLSTRRHEGVRLEGAGLCVFITAGPVTKLFAGGEEESGGHVLCLSTRRLEGAGSRAPQALPESGCRATPCACAEACLRCRPLRQTYGRQ